MRGLIIIFFTVLLSIATSYADEMESVDSYDELEHTMGNVEILPPRFDTVLFRAPRIAIADIYGEATKYYNTSVSQRARGVDWWIADEMFERPLSAQSILAVPVNSRLRLSSTTQDYNYGVMARSTTTIFKGWDLGGSVDFRLGRSLFVDGVFRRDLRPELTLSKRYSLNHYLAFTLKSPFTMRGLQSSSSAEAFELTGNPYYNPSWGYYDGEVRNSRVRQTTLPELNSRYQRMLGAEERTIMGVDLTVGYSYRSLSSIGWYDGSSPMPDYYRRMPSYMPQSTIEQLVEQAWRESDPTYTQIAWDRLVEINQRSVSGSSHYVVEEECSSAWDATLNALFCSDVNESLDITYGVVAMGESSRNFKVLNDLLDGDYLLDIDPYLADYTTSGDSAQSDLRNPDRKVVEGDRFGYDYTIFQASVQGVLGVHYRGDNLEFTLNGRFGDQYLQRCGHYENGRFEGGLSYGESSLVKLPHYNLDGRVIYTLSGGHHFALRVQSMTLEMDAEDLFIQEEYANRVIDNPVAQSINSLSLRYSFMREGFTLDIDGYMMWSRNGSETWRQYDDLSYTYSDCVVSGIGTSSVGVDVVCNYVVNSKLKLNLALAAGNYRYDQAPEVTLYDDVDLSEYSRSTATAIEGCIVGNAPQIVVTSGLTYFINYGLIFSFDGSYAGSRYVSPSFTRRTDRLLRGVSSPEMVADIVEQERLDDVWDLSLSLVKSYWLRQGRRLSLTFRINNLLGTNPSISYGREANRVLTHASGSSTGSTYLQANSYTYGTPRTYYLSCNYYF